MGQWCEILTGVVKLKKEEMQTDFSRCKTGILLIKQALSNRQTSDYKEAIKRIKEFTM
jgi:hypothetical protein